MDDVEVMCMQCGGYVGNVEVMFMLCVCYVDIIDPYCGLFKSTYWTNPCHTLSPVLFLTVLNSLQCFIYVSHGPNEYYYATENCPITQGDKKYICQKKTKNITYMFENFARRYASKSSPVMFVDTGYPVPRNPWRFDARR